MWVCVCVCLCVCIYSTPLPPNLRGSTIRLLQRVQLCTYMWWEVLEWVKMGLKCAHFTCLGIPKGPRSIWEKGIFHPFCTFFGRKTYRFQGTLGFSIGQNG